MKTYEYHPGSLPILISMPHNGSMIPELIKVSMHDYAHDSIDTDWYMDRLYQFTVEMGCHVIQPYYSRYVIDLNRSSNNTSLYPGANVTELCPTTQFDLRPLYLSENSPDEAEVKRRVKCYWDPYHSKLASILEQIKQKFGSALLFEAHSIKSEVPRFFEGRLPDFNFGTNGGASCRSGLMKLINEWQPMGYSKVVNERFKGGYITRNYGKPAAAVDAVQLELSQATYMNETELSFDTKKSALLVSQLRELFEQFCVVLKV